jgi:exonuclease SbcC
MKPVKLVMENFGPFTGKVELDFSKLEDIFLITGKTGAGKTTIFDALCFALYGSVPGSRGDHLTRLRSDHAAGEEGCFVSLEFTLGDGISQKCFLVERTPRQERRKKRGEGSVPVEESLVLYEMVNGVKTRPVSKKTEAAARLKSLIGLEADEFFKIVLLPQGEFAEFLKENTTERLKVLGKLFPVEKAVKVKELARKKALEAESRAEEARRFLEDIGQRVNPLTYEKNCLEASDALEAAGKKCLALEAEDRLINQVLGLRRNEKDAEERLGESRALLEETAGAEVLINEKNETLSRSRAARPLEQFLRGFETAELAAKTAGAAHAAAAQEKDAAEAAADTAEKASLEGAASAKEALAMREKRPALVESIREEEMLKSSAEEMEKQEALAKRLSGGIKLLEDSLAKQELYIEENEALSAKQPSLEKELELSQSIKNIFLEFRKFRERIDDLEREKKSTLKEIADLEKQARDLEKRIPVLEAELKGLREDKARREQADMAAHLSARLEPGKPCPVCGSTEHPCPAKAEAPFGFDERIHAQEASLQEAGNSWASVAARTEAETITLNKSGETRSQLEKEIAEARKNTLPPAEYPANPAALPYMKHNAPLPDRETIERIIRAEAENLNEILGRLKKSRDAAAGLKELYRSRTETQNKLTDTEKSLAGTEVQIKNLSLNITEGRKKQDALLLSISVGQRDGASGMLASLDSLIAKKEEFAAKVGEDREKAMLRLSAAKASLEAAAKNRKDSAASLEEASVSLRQALSATVFSDPAEAEKALLDPHIEETYEREIRGWQNNRAGLETRIAEQGRQLEAIRRDLSKATEFEKVPGLEEAKQRRDTLVQERAAAEDDKTRAFAALNNLKKDREALDEAEKRCGELTAEARKFKALSDDLSGKNPRKIPFDSWLLGNYLEEAAAYATARLEKMSESRYSLLLDPDRQQGRGYAGLDLMVFDSYTGKTRPCATLSGGESFMASVSLALGLADSIQNRSGGVKLDAVFIDEGFGTLDEASLDKALVILDELRDSRMVGLISHVAELRSRIPCRMEVVKTASGSRIAMPE